MKSVIVSALLLATTTVFAIENRTSTLPWTDYPMHNPPTATKFCSDILGNPQMKWGTRTTVTCENKDGIVTITGKATNRDGVERSMTVSANATDVFYAEESGDVFFKYLNDQGEYLYLSTQFVHTGQKLTLHGVEEKGYYQGDMTLSKGDKKVRVGFTDLE